MTRTADHPSASFDGIICLGGEDWWYHNRGHFDFQIMRRLARRWPVLFVNSLGVRMPSLKHDRHFAARIRRKLRSLARGLVNVENGFWVFSPVAAPGAAVASFSRWALAPQIKFAALRAGICRPLLWIHCPPGVALIDELSHAAVVMQRTDRFEAFPDADPVLVGRQIAELRSRADLVVYAAPHLRAEESASVKSSLLVTHGVDLERFIAAGDGGCRTPQDVAAIPGPRIGFIGGIDAHTFDPGLLLKVAGTLSDCHFVMIGSCSLPEGWCRLDNVHLLGRKPYDEIAAYMAAMDALIMPWNRSEWIRACNPIKLKEYLAVGRPVVTTDFPALDGWRDLVCVADTADRFAMHIRSALHPFFDRAIARERLRSESWDAKAETVAAALCQIGNECTVDPARAAA
jgi:glycosyltransferase involved in cell wall biosynthesis